MGKRATAKEDSKEKGGMKDGFNLLPDKFYSRQKKKSRAADINIYGAAAIFVLIAVAAALIGFRYYMELSMQPQRNEVADRWNDAVAMRDVEWEARAIEERLDTLETLETEEIDVFGVLSTIENSVNVDFSWLNIEVDEGLSLTAKVDTFDDGFKMQNQVSKNSSLGRFWADGVKQIEVTAEGAASYVQVQFTVYPDSM